MIKEDTKLKIINAAFEIFSEKGYSATTTKNIAEMAEVNEVTLFRLFETKENLFKKVLDHFADIEYVPKNIKIKPTGNFQADLKTLCKNVLKTISIRNKLITIFIGQAPDNPYIRNKIRTFIIGISKFFTSYLKEIAPEEYRDKIDYEMASLVLMSYFFRYSMSSSILPRDPFNAQSEKNIDRFLDIIINGILTEGK